MSEEAILNRVAVEQYIARLKNDETRVVMVLVYALECPPDWNSEDRWPPTYAAVGRYVGTKFRGKPLSEAAIRYQEICALEELNPDLKGRRKRKKSAEDASD